MGYGIMSYMTNLEDFNKIWGSKISLAKFNAPKEMKAKLGYSFLGREMATKWLRRYNKVIKKEYGYPNFRAHRAIQDIFDGQLSYPNAPWIYTTLLEAIVIEIAKEYYFKELMKYEKNNPREKKEKRTEINFYPPREPEFAAYWEERDKLNEKNQIWEEARSNHIYSRLLIGKAWNSYLLPNDHWCPCDLSIMKYLPLHIPIPIPTPEDFPFISSIKNNELLSVFNKIDFEGHSKEAIDQMSSWFNCAKQEGRDLIFFLY